MGTRGFRRPSYAETARSSGNHADAALVRRHVVDGAVCQVDFAVGGRFKSGQHHQAGESHDIFYVVIKSNRKSSSQAAAWRLERMLPLPFDCRKMLLAMCLIVAKLAGALSLRMRHSSSRKIMSMTQCNPFSTPQCCRIAAAMNSAPAQTG